MAAGVGQLIEDTDYNSIRTKINNVMGANTDGYGQALVSSDVSNDQVITASQWNNLRIDIAKARGHQTGDNELANLTEPVNTTPGAGQSLDITNAIRSQFDTMADACVTNKRVCAATQGSAEALSGGTGTRSTTWSTKLTHSITVQFSNANEARYFFNAGGQIRFSANFSVTPTGTKGTTWDTMVKQQGTAYLDYTQTGQAVAGTPTNAFGSGSLIGFYDLTTTDQQIYRKDAPSGVYAENNYRILARLNTGFGSGTEPTEIIFTIEFNDADTGDRPSPSPPPPYGPLVDETVNGTINSVVSVFRPSGTNVSVTAPTVKAGATFTGT